MTFNDKCYQLLSQIPQGKVSTYKEIASALNTKAYQAVGNAMAKNPNLIFIPCHRIVKSDGSIGKYALGVNKKISFLKHEGVLVREGKILDFENCFYSFK